jgi:hypothetical protein
MYWQLSLNPLFSTGAIQFQDVAQIVLKPQAHASCLKKGLQAERQSSAAGRPGKT